MGKITNLISAKVSGNVGAMNFRRRGDETVVAERSYANSSKGNGATEAQRLHRSRLGNIVTFFRAISAIEARAWEGKGQYVSDFNMLAKVNLATSPIYLTKEEVALNSSVIAPYIVSRGTLKALSQYWDGTTFVPGVNVEPNFQLADATVAQLSASIIALNEGWQYGDKLSFAGLRQQLNNISGVMVPQVAVVYFELTLDAENTALVLDLANAGIVQVDVNANGRLQFLEGFDAAFAIHSRKSAGYLETSEQIVRIQNPSQPQYNKYKSDMQRDAAMLSYGFQGEVLLTPYSEGEPERGVAAQFSSVTLGGVAITDGGTTTAPGSLVINGENLTAANCYLTCNGVRWSPQSVTDTAITYFMDKSGIFVVHTNGEVVFSWTSNVPEPESVVTSVKFDGNTYTGSKSGLALSFNATTMTGTKVNFEINGENLGQLSAVGCEFTTSVATATKIVGQVWANSSTASDWSVKTGDNIALAGPVNVAF